MSLRVNHNTASLNGIRNLQKNDAAVSKSLERLSSGLKINRASDNSAGLIISEQMRAQLKGLDTAVSNSETAVSMIQTAEGALDEVNTLLGKARGLALHSANEGANDNAQLQADQTELDNIMSSVDRIATNTQFGTKKLLDGSMTNFRSANSAIVGSAQTGNDYATQLKAATVTKGYHSLRVNVAATQGNTVLGGGTTDITTGAATIEEMSGSHIFNKAFVMAINGVQVSVASGTTKNDLINQLNPVGKSLGFSAIVSSAAAGGTAAATAGITSGAANQASTGAIVLINKGYGSSSSFTFSFVSGATGAVNISGASTAGADMSGTLILYTGASVGGTATSGGTEISLEQSGATLTLVSSNALGYRINLKDNLSLSGGTGGSGFYMGVIDGTTAGASFQIGANAGQTASIDMASTKAGDLGVGVSATYKNLGALSGSLTSGNATEALKVIDKAIDDVTNMRGKLGAFQANTLETNISSLKVSKENLTAAESSIRDVDFAEESANFTKNNILVQSATAMLAQANQLPNNVLKLLG